MLRQLLHQSAPGTDGAIHRDQGDLGRTVGVFETTLEVEPILVFSPDGPIQFGRYVVFVVYDHFHGLTEGHSDIFRFRLHELEMRGVVLFKCGFHQRPLFSNPRIDGFKIILRHLRKDVHLFGRCGILLDVNGIEIDPLFFGQIRQKTQSHVQRTADIIPEFFVLILGRDLFRDRFFLHRIIQAAESQRATFTPPVAVVVLYMPEMSLGSSARLSSSFYPFLISSLERFQYRHTSGSWGLNQV